MWLVTTIPRATTITHLKQKWPSNFTHHRCVGRVPTQRQWLLHQHPTNPLKTPETIVWTDCDSSFFPSTHNTKSPRLFIPFKVLVFDHFNVRSTNFKPSEWTVNELSLFCLLSVSVHLGTTILLPPQILLISSYPFTRRVAQLNWRPKMVTVHVILLHNESVSKVCYLMDLLKTICLLKVRFVHLLINLSSTWQEMALHWYIFS